MRPAAAPIMPTRKEICSAANCGVRYLPTRSGCSRTWTTRATSSKPTPQLARGSVCATATHFGIGWKRSQHRGTWYVVIQIVVECAHVSVARQDIDDDDSSADLETAASTLVQLQRNTPVRRLRALSVLTANSLLSLSLYISVSRTRSDVVWC